MGAGCVVATGCNEAALADVARRFDPRLRPVTLSGNEDEDGARMRRTAPDAIDCVLDILPPSVDARVARMAIMTVRPYGSAGVELPYPWIMRNGITIRGQWMYSPGAAVQLTRLVRSGLLALANYAITEFALDDTNDAVTHAAASVLPLYTEGGIFMPPYSQSAVGKEAVGRAYDMVVRELKFDVKFNIAEIVQMAPHWAFVRTNSAGSTLHHSTGKTTSEANQELFILKKGDDNKWRIARYSFSPTNPPSR